MDRPVTVETPEAAEAGNLTRTDALGFARYIYSYVTSRALRDAGDEREYVLDLAGSWDARLSDLVGTADLMSRHELLVLDRLTSAAMHSELSRAAMIEWVDAFPSAVFRLFAPSAVEVDESSG